MSKVLTNNLEAPDSLVTVTSGTILDCTGNLVLPNKATVLAPASQGSVYFDTTTGTATVVKGSATATLGSQANPASSAAALVAAGITTSGAYYINLPTVGSKLTYCELGSSFAGGGGWMLALKCTAGGTFNYGSSYWTSANTLNETATNNSDGDAKFDVFNYFTGTKYLAIFPTLNNGGQTSGYGSGWSWLATGYGGYTCLNRFQTSTQISGNPRGESMWSGSGFSAQGGFQWYGFNYTGNGSNLVRWGFGWNNEGDQGSNDVSGGIGMNRQSWSAGDTIGCCQSTTGVNTNFRALIYVQ